MIKHIKLLICVLLLITNYAKAQQHIDQNGLKTTVTDILSADLSQPLRYEIATLGFNSYHWQQGGLIIIELFSPYHNTGYEKYILNVGSGTGVGDGSPALTLTETAGNLHVAKITLGTVYDLQTTLGGYINKALPIYMDVRYHARYRARITYQQDKVNVVDNLNQIAINVSPVAQTIGDFEVSTVLNNPITSSKNLMIEGSGNHYIANGNVGIGTTTPTTTLDINGNLNIGGTFVNPEGFHKNINVNGSEHAIFRVNGGNVLSGFFSDQTLPHPKARLGTFSEDGLGFFTGRYDNVRLFLSPTGNVGIGTTIPTEKLAINGKIRAKEIRVDASNWPDYVFEEGYKIEKLSKLESYIKANKHLPEIPPAKEVEVNGVELGEMNKILLKKIEELTLHLIEKNKKINQQEQRLKAIEEYLNIK